MELSDCGDLMSSARTFRRYRYTPRAAFAPRRLPDAPARSTHDVEIRPRDAGLDNSCRYKRRRDRADMPRADIASDPQDHNLRATPPAAQPSSLSSTKNPLPSSTMT